ncbi:MAG: hypothetical protein ABI878_13905 [Acidobacteriota bacterium]
MTWKVPERYRISPQGAESFKGETFGWFRVPSPDPSRAIKTLLLALASDGMQGIDWEHVSVRAAKNINGQTKDCLPTWGEMCFIKSLFWDAADCVIQYHPPEKDYINRHHQVLHLWRPKSIDIPMPPKIAV